MTATKFIKEKVKKGENITSFICAGVVTDYEEDCIKTLAASINFFRIIHVTVGLSELTDTARKCILGQAYIRAAHRSIIKSNNSFPEHKDVVKELRKFIYELTTDGYIIDEDWLKLVDLK